MKKTRLLLLFVCFAFTTSTPFCAIASFVSKPFATPISENGKDLTISELINFSSDDFVTFYGKRMNILEKISFKVMKMRKELKKDPDLLVSKYYSRTIQKRLESGWWVLIIHVSLAILLGLLIALAMASWSGPK